MSGLKDLQASSIAYRSRGPRWKSGSVSLREDMTDLSRNLGDAPRKTKALKRFAAFVMTENCGNLLDDLTWHSRRSAWFFQPTFALVSSSTISQKSKEIPKVWKIFLANSKEVFYFFSKERLKTKSLPQKMTLIDVFCKGFSISAFCLSNTFHATIWYTCCLKSSWLNNKINLVFSS